MKSKEPSFSDREEHFVIPVKPCFQSVINLVACMRHFPKCKFTLCCIMTPEYEGKEKIIEDIFQKFNKQYDKPSTFCNVAFIKKGYFDLVCTNMKRMLPFKEDDDIDLTDFHTEMYLALNIMVQYNDFMCAKKIDFMIWDSIVFPLKRGNMPYIYEFFDTSQAYEEQLSKLGSSNPLSFLFDDLKYDKSTGTFYHPCIRNIELILEKLKEFDLDCQWLDKSKIEKTQAKKKRQLLEKNQNVQVVYS